MCASVAKQYNMVLAKSWQSGRSNQLSSFQLQQTNIQFFYRPDVLPVAQPTVSKHCWLGDRKGIWPVKKLDVGLLVVMI